MNVGFRSFSLWTVCLVISWVVSAGAANVELRYATFLGGTQNDYIYAVALDAQDGVYLAGKTSSTDFPTADPLQAAFAGSWDAVVAKLSSSGSALLFSTYLGGNTWDEAYGVALDSEAAVYVTGYTMSGDFPTLNAYQTSNAPAAPFMPRDAFVTKLTSSGSALIYSTYLGGGSGGTGQETGEAVGVDLDLCAYVAGKTTSDDFPTLNAYQAGRSSVDSSEDVFVTKLGSAGSTLVYSTYLGGAASDSGKALAVDVAGRACVVGETASADFPVKNAYQSHQGGVYDAFVTALDSTGSTLAFSTCLGGSHSSDRAYAVVQAGPLDCTVAGYVASDNFPVLNAYQPGYGGGTFDGFVARLVLPHADLAIMKTAMASNAVGQALTYQLMVTNAGPFDASSVVVTDELPPGVTPTGVVITNLGSLAVGAVTSFPLVVTIDSATHGELTNTATVTADELDLNTADNTDEAVTVIPLDYDRDGMVDGWEVTYGLSPTNAADAGDDNDGDGETNGDEHTADTHPGRSNEYFRIDGVTGTTQRAVYFQSSTGRLYTLEFINDLISGGWTNLPGQTDVRGTGGPDSLQDTNDPPAARTYRLKVRRP